jgi:hypothetical protein
VGTHDRIQVGQLILMVLCVAYGVVLFTNSGGLASRMLDGLRQHRVYARTPVWTMRAFGVWVIVFGIGQFFLLRYLPK